MHRNCGTNILLYFKCAIFKTYFNILTHACISLNYVFVNKHPLNYKIKPEVTEMESPTHFWESVLLNSSLQTGSKNNYFVVPLHMYHTRLFITFILGFITNEECLLYFHVSQFILSQLLSHLEPLSPFLFLYIYIYIYILFFIIII